MIAMLLAGLMLRETSERIPHPGKRFCGLINPESSPMEDIQV